jgi:hypothetical protein
VRAHDPSRLSRGTLCAAALLAAALLAASPVAAQRADSARAGAAPARRPARAAAVDTTPRPPLSPRRAFVYSALVPGVGQSRLQRYNAGALFVGVEMASIAMLVKSRADLRQVRRLYQDSIIVGYTGPDATGAVTATYQQCRTSRDVERPCPVTQDRVRARRLHTEDWIAAIIFNHLFAGADAFVAAQLWDLPAQVSAAPTERGVRVSARVAW